MKAILFATTITTIPALASAFSVGGYNNLGQAVVFSSMKTTASHVSHPRDASPLMRLYQSRRMDDVDEAFDKLKDEIHDSRSVSEDAVSKSKKWVNRYYDLFADLNQDDVNSPREEVAQRNEMLRKQQQWTNKVIDFAAELGQDLSSLDLDGMNQRVASPAGVQNGPKATSFGSKKTTPLVYSIKDEANIFRVDIELPGVNLGDVDIQLDKETNMVAISGERQLIGSNKETPTAKFAQRVALGPDVDTDKLSASLSRGILTISAPKLNVKKQDKTRRIPISSS